MAKAKKEPTQQPAEFPKPLVRLKAAVGGYDAEVRMVADADGETAAKAEGFEPVTVPERGAEFAEYPKWLYHRDGRAVVVQNADEAAKQEGFEETPPAPEPGEVEGDRPKNG